MRAMDAMIAMQSFISAADQERVFFGIAQAARSHMRWWLWLLVAVLVYPAFFVFAQVVPFVFGNHVNLIKPYLPSVTDRTSLIWLKDAFTLYHAALTDYRRVCLFRGRVDAILDELDEEIDSLELVLERGKFLQDTAAEITRR
jgi:hypothetical protein